MLFRIPSTADSAQFDLANVMPGFCNYDRFLVPGRGLVYNSARTSGWLGGNVSFLLAVIFLRILICLRHRSSASVPRHENFMLVLSSCVPDLASKSTLATFSVLIKSSRRKGTLTQYYQEDSQNVTTSLPVGVYGALARMSTHQDNGLS